MNHRADFRFEQSGTASGVLFDGAEAIAEIRDLCLYNVRFRPGGSWLLGNNVPLPLYWQQYANHQHPERNAGSDGEVRCLAAGSDHITLECSGVSRSGEVKSTVILEVSYAIVRESYVFDCHCDLSVAPGKSWHVTRNESHGELEFCNLWPAGTFVTTGHKRYQNCFLEKRTATYRIPHHHLETRDKHNIRMGKGDRFLWLLEEENPVVEIRSGDVVAGLCAYMWDAHFALRVCEENEGIRLKEGTEYQAVFRLYSIARSEGEWIRNAATTIDVPEIAGIPVYTQGVNSFATTLPPDHCFDVWPWEHESDGNAECRLDRKVGHSDHSSLRISSQNGGYAVWKVTALGPAFGGEPFEDGKRYRLSAFVKTTGLRGSARLGVRLHREGRGDVFDTGSYENFRSPGTLSGDTDWIRMEITTPPVSPAPDRMHLLLQQTGEGTSWFDDVLFERNV